MEFVLGRGGSATVWSGRDAMGRAVAIKVPHDVGWVADVDAARTEQHVLMAVRHEHLVPLRDVVPMADGRTALVFDLVEGAPLSRTVKARGHLRPGEVVTVITPLCEAVAALHAAAGLHADISPANVMVTADGRPLLLDLGAARLAGSPPAEPVFGTVGFVAPEVRQGVAPSEASDVFSLGAVAWFCLTGNGAPDTVLRLDPDIIRSHVGPELAAVIGACIDPDPALRPASSAVARLFFDAAPAEAIEVVVATDEASALTHRLRAEAREEVDSPSPARSSMLTALAAGHHLPWPLTRRAWLLLGLGVLAAVALGAGALTARSSAFATDTAQHQASSAASSARAAPLPAQPTPTPTPTRQSEMQERVLRDADAPEMAAQDLLQALSDRRALALRRRAVAALSSVELTSSPAWAADAALIERLRKDATTWEGLGLEVARASPVSTDGTHAVVRARVDWTAYVARRAGRPLQQPAASGQLLDFTLVRGADGWRLAAVSAPAT